MTDLRLGRWQDVLRDDPADGTVRLILTSPPYDNARTYEGTNEPVDFDELAAWALRKLMSGGTMAMVLDGAVNNGEQSTTPNEVICAWSSGLPHRVIRALMRGERVEIPPVSRPPWRFLQNLAYGRQGAPGAYKGRFRRDHEPLILFVKDGAPHVCEKGRIATESKHNLQEKAGGHAGVRRRDGSKETFGVSRRGVRVVANVLHRGSMWIYGSVGNGHDPSSSTGHPATFAERFARDAVNVWSNPGDLVVDPFAGSATVGRACEDLGRRFIGAERVPKYHAIGTARLAQRGLLKVAS